MKTMNWLKILYLPGHSPTLFLHDSPRWPPDYCVMASLQKLCLIYLTKSWFQRCGMEQSYGDMKDVKGLSGYIQKVYHNMSNVAVLADCGRYPLFSVYFCKCILVEDVY